MRARLATVVLSIAAAACGRAASPQPAQSAAAAAPAAQTAPLPASPADGYLPLPRVPFAPARPMAVVEAVFHFAADHPEVLSKVPCFCGCENRGHRHNDDCFVAARDARGRVTAWEPHGIG